MSSSFKTENIALEHADTSLSSQRLADENQFAHPPPFVLFSILRNSLPLA